MTVILIMDDGSQVMLSRSLVLNAVAKKVNEARGAGKLIELETDRTPTGQMTWVDPDRVARVYDDR